MLGQRLRTARQRRGLTQEQAATVIDRDRTLITHVEKGRVGLSAESIARLALELRVSTDYLLGNTDDPTPIEEYAAATLNVGFIPIYTNRVSAGNPGDTIEIMPEETPYPFRRFRLEEAGVDPDHAKVFRVVGDCMKPILTDGCTILVDFLRNVLRENCIYVFRAEGDLLVKRAKKCGSDWWWCSENPEWEPVRHDDTVEVWGEVRWCGRRFNRFGE